MQDALLVVGPDNEYRGVIRQFRAQRFINEKHERLYRQFQNGGRKYAPFRKVKGKPRISRVKPPMRIIYWKVDLAQRSENLPISRRACDPFGTLKQLSEYLQANSLRAISQYEFHALHP